MPSHVQSQSLLRVITLALEQRLPLAPLLRAFAEDQSGSHRWRVHRVAGILESGSSLPSALEQVAGVLPVENVLAIRFGAQSGTLPTTLRSLVEETKGLTHSRSLWPLYGTLIYVAIVALIMLGILTFLMLVIAPKFEAMMGDYGARSLMFAWLVGCSQLFVECWWLIVVVALGLVWMWWAKWPAWFWRLGWIRPWHDMRSADVLQNLSIVTKAGRPVPGAISTLARYHHDPLLRQELLFVRNEVEQGAEVWAALGKVKLLSSAEMALLHAAEKVGNVPWVMTQLAQCKRRRAHRRIDMLGQLAQPAAILLLGGIVLVVCLGMYAPILQLLWSTF